MAQEREIMRAKMMAIFLRTYHKNGLDTAVSIYKGNADAALLNLMAHIGRDATWEYVAEVFGEVRPPRSTPTLVFANGDYGKGAA